MCHTACSLGQPAIQLGGRAGRKGGGSSCKGWVHLESKGVLLNQYPMSEGVALESPGISLTLHQFLAEEKVQLCLLGSRERRSAIRQS